MLGGLGALTSIVRRRHVGARPPRRSCDDRAHLLPEPNAKARSDKKEATIESQMFPGRDYWYPHWYPKTKTGR